MDGRMGVWAYLDRGLKLEENGLGDEDLTSLCAQETDFGLKQLDLLAGATATDLQKSVDYRVQINIVLICHCVCVGRQKLAWEWLRGRRRVTRRKGWDALRWDEILRSQAGRRIDTLLSAKLGLHRQKIGVESDL